jgi:iron complex outermembrane recepter protein
LENDIDQLQLKGSWDNLDRGALTRVNFGYSRTEQKFKNRNAYSGQLPAGFWLTSAGYWPDEIWQTGDFRGLLRQLLQRGQVLRDTVLHSSTFDTAKDLWETVGTDDPIAEFVYWPSWPAEFQDPSGTRGRVWSGSPGQLGRGRGR